MFWSIHFLSEVTDVLILTFFQRFEELLRWSIFLSICPVHNFCSIDPHPFSLSFISTQFFFHFFLAIPCFSVPSWYFYILLPTTDLFFSSTFLPGFIILFLLFSSFLPPPRYLISNWKFEELPYSVTFSQKTSIKQHIIQFASHHRQIPPPPIEKYFCQFRCKNLPIEVN